MVKVKASAGSHVARNLLQVHGAQDQWNYSVIFTDYVQLENFKLVYDSLFIHYRSYCAEGVRRCSAGFGP